MTFTSKGVAKSFKRGCGRDVEHSLTIGDTIVAMVLLRPRPHDRVTFTPSVPLLGTPFIRFPVRVQYNVPPSQIPTVASSWAWPIEAAETRTIATRSTHEEGFFVMAMNKISF